MKSTLTSTTFYGNIADRYDEMTRYSARFTSEQNILRKWVERYRLHSVLDVACGTGLHAILLARMGLHVYGADSSLAMLERAQKHAQEVDAEVTWIHSSMQELTRHVDATFDAVLCLGNSFPHLLTAEDAYEALNNFETLLNPGGIVVIQVLNYDRILKEKKRIVGINRNENREYIRFYDFNHDSIRFNVLYIEWENGKNSFDLFSTALYPYRKREIEAVLQKLHFSEITFYGDLSFNEFELNSSHNLIVVARKASNRREVYG